LEEQHILAFTIVRCRIVQLCTSVWSRVNPMLVPGISMTNRPMARFGVFEQWRREISLPTPQAWVDDEL
jgi:hypothetical protein